MNDRIHPSVDEARTLAARHRSARNPAAGIEIDRKIYDRLTALAGASAA